MPIVRSPRLERDFTIISNAVLRDSRLSYRARGILAAILSRPDNWRTDSTSLAREAREGREAVRSAMDELEQFGYLMRRKIRGEGGKWATECFVFDTPQVAAGQTEDGFPGAGSPGVGNLGAIRSTVTKDLEEVGDSQNHSGPRSRRDDFQSSPQIPRPRRKSKAKRVLTPEEFQASWQHFLHMDLEDLDTDRDVRNSAFFELIDQHGAIEPDKWAQGMIDRGEWSGFCASFDLGNNLEPRWASSKSA